MRGDRTTSHCPTVGYALAAPRVASDIVVGQATRSVLAFGTTTVGTALAEVGSGGGGQVQR